MKSSHPFRSLVLSVTIAISTPHIAAAQAPVTTAAAAAQVASPELSKTTARELLRRKLAQTYAIADFNGDRIPDLALADFLTDTLHVLTGDGHGRFQSAARLSLPGGPRAIVVADLNNDTLPDLAVACFLSGEVRTYLSSPVSGGLFAEPDAVQLSPGLSSIVVRDFNDDGYLDLAVANFLSGEIRLLQGVGGGAFATPRSIGYVAATTLILSHDRSATSPGLVAFGGASEAAHMLSRDVSGAFTDMGTVQQAAALVRESDPQPLKEVSGDGQFGRSGDELRDPFIVESLDAFGRNTAGQSVIFSSPLGHGTWRNEALRVTDEQGHATATLQLAPSPETHVLVAARDDGELSVFGALAVMPREWFLTRLANFRPDLSTSRLVLSSTANDVAEVGDLAAYIERSGGDASDTARRLTNQLLLVGSQIDISTARALPCDTALADRIDLAGEVDNFTFSVTGNQEIVHVAARPDGFGAISWQLIDANGTLVACTPTTIFSRDCGPLSDAGNPYVVQVRSTAGLPSYRIHLQRLTDGSACSTKTLICNTPASDTIESLSDTDLLRFDGVSGERVHVSVSGGGLGFFPFWRLLDPAGRQVACEGVVSFAGGERDCDLPVNGAYGVEVMDDNLGATGTYSLQLQRLTAGRTCGVGIICNVPISDAVNARIEALADTDLFTFDGAAGERVHITLDLGSLGFFPIWRLLDPSGKEVSCDGVATFAKGGRDCTIPANGTYAIEVMDDFMNALGQYSVHLQRLTEGRTCGVPVTCNIPFSDPATRVEAGADTDLFTFTGTAGEHIFASVTGAPGSLGFAPQWRVLDPAGSAVACDAATSGFGGGRRGCDLLMNGRHSLEVMDPDTFGIGSYTLLVECAGAPPIPTLPLNEPLTVTLQRSTPLMFDIIVPIGAPDLFVTLQKHALWSGTVTLRSGNGQVVATSNILADVLLHVPQPVPGPYRLELTGAGSGVLIARMALPTLTFGQPMVGTILRQWGSAWYQMDVPPDQNQLSVAVETLGFFSRLELFFARFGVPPLKAANGDRITLEIPSPAAGRYYVHLMDSAEILGAGQSRDHQIVADLRPVQPPGPRNTVITSVSPTTVGQGIVSIALAGTGLSGATAAELSRVDGAGEIALATNLQLTADGSHVTATFDLTATLVGQYRLSILTTSFRRLDAPVPITVRSGGRAHLWINVTGRQQIRAGRASTVVVDFGNDGDIDAYDLLLEIHLPGDVSVVADLPHPPDPAIAWQSIPVAVTRDSKLILPLWLLRVGAGTSNRIALSITAGQTRLGQTFSVTASVYRLSSPFAQSGRLADVRTSPVFGALVQAISEILATRSTTGLAPKLLLAAATDTPDTAVSDALFDRAETFWEFVPTREAVTVAFGYAVGWVLRNPVFGLEAGLEAAPLVASGALVAYTVIHLITGVLEAFDSLDLSVVGSISPEDKYGPSGFGGDRWVTADARITYRIDFWNKEDAPAPTQNVFVTDTVDQNLNWSTFAFTEFGFLRWRVKLEPTQFFNIDVDTRPDFNLIVNVQGTFDPETGNIEWQFHSLDPATRQAPDDPFAGFLPPITATAFEIGWVDFSVSPKAGLPTGTTIANKSFVKFDVDVFKPAPPAGPFINTLDADRPVSEVQPLAPLQTSASFTVQWSGSDVGAGIRDYTILVSANGGTYTAWQTNTAATSAVFTGQPGTTYTFYSVARDNTGLLEAAPAAADSTTTISANLAPMANAGPDQEVPFGRFVILDGSGSSDDGGIQPLQFSWVSDTGFVAQGQIAKFALPVGIHVFTLTVSDGELTSTDSVTVTVMPPNTDGIGDSAVQLLRRRVTADQNSFAVYVDQDSGFNHGFPSGFFGNRATIHIDSGCIDDAASLNGCSADPNALDRVHGSVLRISFGPQAPGTFAGVNIEEPENWGTRRAGLGYDLTGASRVVFDARSPNGAVVEFSVGSCTAGFRSIPTEWTPMSIELIALSCLPDLSAVHLLLGVATNDVHAPDGATVLVDNVRFEPAPTRPSGSAFPLSTQTFGVAPRVDRPIPFDQSLRNLTTTYESALTALAFLARATPDDLLNARRIADAFDYALHHESTGDPLPVGANESRGLHNGYESGDLALFNDQEAPKQGRAGEVRLSGFTAPVLCPGTGFCLMLDGATGGNNAFAILALLAAFRQFGDERYLNDAITIGNWIVSNLQDSSGTGYGGYFLGYPDEGVPPPKPLLRGKSTENNADIFAALTTLAAVESQRGNVNEALRWSTAANVAGDFIMRMFDPTAGRFNVGTVPPATAPAPGICPDGPQEGSDTINTCDFIDSNTFTTLALAGMPRYRARIDWRRPIQYVRQRFAQAVTAGDHTFEGFNIVPAPAAGANGVAWEFTAQAVQAMRFVDQLYAETTFEAAAAGYLAHIAHAQQFAPFGDGFGLVASTLQDGASLAPSQQCLETPFQCIPERVGLAATTWAMFAHQNVNLFQPSRYVVLEPPTITVNSPTEPIYELNSLVMADYSCSGAVTCDGDVASGSALDTSTPGPKSFTIVATDATGNTTTQVVTFAVSLGTCVAPLAGLSVWLSGDGTAKESISGRMATWIGTEAYVAGKAGMSFSLDGTSYLTLPFQQQGAFTLHAWVRAPQRLLPEFTGVLASGGSAGKQTSFQIELDGSGNYRLNAGDSALSWLIGPALDVFQHVAVTFDGAIMSTFLSGQLVQREGTDAVPGLGFATLTLGVDRDGVNFFAGALDEVQVLNRALTDEEIAQAFLAGAAGSCRNRPPIAVAQANPNPAEATDPDGAIVTLDGNGSSDPDLDTLTCTWREGNTLLGTDCLLSLRFSIGSHPITLTVNDGHDLTADAQLTIDVRDTVAPELRITSPADTLPIGSVFSVVVQATDAVGSVGVSVNGLAAQQINGTPQSGTWAATVPIALPVTSGGALTFDVRTSDAAGNLRTGMLFVDTDGIPASMDRNRASGVDESDRYSNDFVTGWTAGSLIRNGWTTRLSSAPALGGVRATVSGAGSIARISACTGAAKELRLDVIGETADIACAETGTITVKAISAVLQIELRERLATGTIQQFILRTGQSMSVGSPATASTQNSEPISAQLITIDNAGLETVVGSYDLAPGASVDVSPVAGARGSRHRLRFNVLRGNVSVTVNGRKRVLKSGQLATLTIG